MISSRVKEDAAGKMALEVDDLGEPELKNIAAKIRAYRVRLAAPASAPVQPALALPDKPSVAVLPFQNMSGDPEQEYFADGMVEEIITALSRIRWLFVIARNSSFTYKGRAVDIKQVGRELGVRYVLEGSVRKGGNRVRITAQLIDAITGTHVWADRYDRDISDIFAVQDEITASVAGAIEPALADAEQQRVLRKPPKSLDAWEAYQRGLWHFNKYAPEENQIALGFFRQAIGLDPNFAPGHYGYALALQWDIWHFSERPFSEVQGTPRDEARIAVSLDDKDAMAHAVLAHIWMWNSEWEAAISEARTALTLNPNSAFVIGMLGCVLGFGGYRDEALDRLQQAMRASPHDPLTWLWTNWRALYSFTRVNSKRRWRRVVSLLACVRNMAPSTDTSPRPWPCWGGGPRHARFWSAPDRGLQTRVGGKDRPGCGRKTLPCGSRACGLRRAKPYDAGPSPRHDLSWNTDDVWHRLDQRDRLGGCYRCTTSSLLRRRQPRTEICLEQRRRLEARPIADTRAEFFKRAAIVRHKLAILAGLDRSGFRLPRNAPSRTT